MKDKKFEQMVDNYSNAVRKFAQESLAGFRPQSKLSGRIRIGRFNPFKGGKDLFTKINRSKLSKWEGYSK